MTNLMQPQDYDEAHLQLPCYISAKVDGVRCYDDGRSLKFRSGNPIWGVNHIHTYIRGLGFDGEMLIPGLSFDESSGQIRSHAESPDAHLYVFDSTTMPRDFARRHRDLQHLMLLSDQVHILKHEVVTTRKQLFEKHKRNLELGFEGSVVKTPHHYYQYRKSWDWMRIVPVHSVDAKVYGVYEGKGKYVGMLGGVLYRGEGVTGKVGTGFDDAQRKYYWLNQDRIVDKTIRITFKEKTRDGSLRHPSFDRVRIDK